MVKKVFNTYLWGVLPRVTILEKWLRHLNDQTRSHLSEAGEHTS